MARHDGDPYLLKDWLKGLFWAIVILVSFAGLMAGFSWWLTWPEWAIETSLGVFILGLLTTLIVTSP